MNKIFEFQKSENLFPDGIIGIKTITAFRNKFELTALQVAHFLGQLDHETASFTKDTENLNYSPNGLISTFSYYKKNKAEAWIDGRNYLIKANQNAIGNKVYADKNRSKGYELGNINSGDGFKFIGRGAIQITGRTNYTNLAAHLRDFEILAKPELVATKYFWESALFFFKENNLFELCKGVSTIQINKVTAVINKGTDSYQDRVNLVREYYKKARL